VMWSGLLAAVACDRASDHVRNQQWRLECQEAFPRCSLAGNFGPWWLVPTNCGTSLSLSHLLHNLLPTVLTSYLRLR